MTRKDDGGTAFPVYHLNAAQNPLPRASGMSLRDWFAGQALIGYMALEKHSWPGEKEIAEAAYLIADAMLRARSATGEPNQ